MPVGCRGCVFAPCIVTYYNCWKGNRISGFSLPEMFPTPLTCWNWIQSSRSKLNSQTLGRQPVLQPWHVLTLASTQNHTHRQSSRDTEYTPSFCDLPFRITPTRRQTLMNPSPLGFPHSRHLINISGLNEAGSADSRLSGNNLP